MDNEKEEKLDEIINELKDEKDESSETLDKEEQKEVIEAATQENSGESVEEIKDTQEEKTEVQEEKKEEPKETKKKGKKGVVICLLLVVIIAFGALGYYLYQKDSKPEKKEIKTEKKSYKSEFRMTGNDIQDFDLYFLQVENTKNNAIYSPLSIKYALAMLADAAKGDSKEQITSIIGDYKSKKYVNSSNLSLANAMFIKNSFKDKVKESYINTLKEKYDAEVQYDAFENAKQINKWVNDHTFNLIPETLEDAKARELEFALVNALAIDMDWNYKIQAQTSNSKVESKFYSVRFKHEKYEDYVRDLEMNDTFDMIDFNNGLSKVSAPEFGATLSNYDIIKELGADNIRNEVEKEYREYLKHPNCGEKTDEESIKQFLDTYMEEIGSNYKFVDYSTDFMFHKDEDVTVFAKDLKTYDGTTLQYVAVMPNKEELTEYIKNLNAKKVNEIVNNLKELKYDSLSYGKVYKLRGHVPLFKTSYELKLIEDLESLGVKDIFDISKADLSSLIDGNEKLYIGEAVHKATIEFSNDGIKAGAVTAGGGKGAASCDHFDKIYEVPVEEIDLNFNKPFIYLIRDKDTNEVWFTGRIYDPSTK